LQSVWELQNAPTPKELPLSAVLVGLHDKGGTPEQSPASNVPASQLGAPASTGKIAWQLLGVHPHAPALWQTQVAFSAHW
jgi:hypothetical protein